jgi:hypothetical protein
MNKKMLILALSATAIALAAFTGSASAAVTLGALAQTETQPGGCTACTFVQVDTDPAYPSYKVPSDGVITSFAIQVGSKVENDSSVIFDVMHNVFGISYAIDAQTGLVKIPPSAAATTFRTPTSISVHSGQVLGLTINSGAPDGNTPGVFDTNSLSNHIGSFPFPPNVGEATNLNGPGSQGYQLNMQAVLEPDADKDGFGDDSQDCFPSDATRHGAICPDTLAPTVSELRTKHSKFAVNKKGTLIASKTSKPSKGTTFTFKSSEAATVAFSISRVSKSAKTKKTTLKLVETFKRSATAGANSVAYSGRFLDVKKRKTALKAGKYRLTVTPVDSAGNVGLPQSKSFTIVS